MPDVMIAAAREEFQPPIGVVGCIGVGHLAEIGIGVRPPGYAKRFERLCQWMGQRAVGIASQIAHCALIPRIVQVRRGIVLIADCSWQLGRSVKELEVSWLRLLMENA